MPERNFDNTKLEFAIEGVDLISVLGVQDALLRSIEAAHPNVSVLVRGNSVTLSGNEAECFAAKKLVDEAISLVKAGHSINPTDIAVSAKMLQQDQSPAQQIGRAHV